MPMPMAEIRKSAKRAMSRAIPRSLLRRLRLYISKKSSLCSPGLVIHQASVPNQCRHWPDVSLQINAGGCVGQKIDREADRLNTTCVGTEAAVQDCRAARAGVDHGQRDDDAILVVGLKDRKILEAANGCVVGGIGVSPGRITCYRQPVSVGISARRHSAIDDVLQFQTPSSGVIHF